MVVGLALIGAGRMGAVHAEIIHANRQVELVAVVDRDSDAARRVARGAPISANVDEVLAMDSVQGVVVAAPTPVHPEIVDAAISHGVHVLCEKPLSFDPATSVDLAARADEAAVVLGVGFWRRFARPWARAKELIDQGAIGRPLLIRLSQWDANPPPPAFCARDVSGGIFIDCGVHEFGLADFLLRTSVTRVLATALPCVDPQIAAVGDLDNAVVQFETDSGVVGLVDLSRNARYADDVRTEILGSEGALFVDGVPGGRLRLGDRDGVRIVAGTAMVDVMQGGVTAQLEAFAAAIRGGPNRLADGLSSASATAVGLAAWDSIDTGSPVGVG